MKLLKTNNYLVTIISPFLLIIAAVVLITARIELNRCHKINNLYQEYYKNNSSKESYQLFSLKFDNTQLDTCIRLVNSVGKEISIRQLASKGIIAVRLFVETCFSCQEDKIRIIQQEVRKAHLPVNILINAGSLTELKKIAERLSIPESHIFLIDSPERTILPFDKEFLQYFFWTDSTCSISDFYVFDQNHLSTTINYFKLINTKHCQ